MSVRSRTLLLCGAFVASWLGGYLAAELRPPSPIVEVRPIPEATPRTPRGGRLAARQRLRDGSAGPIVHLPERRLDHDDVGRRAIGCRTSTDAIVTLDAIDDARFQHQPFIESCDTGHVAVADILRVRRPAVHAAIPGRGVSMRQRRLGSNPVKGTIRSEVTGQRSKVLNLILVIKKKGDVFRTCFLSSKER